MFLAPTALATNEVCRAEREVSRVYLTRTVPPAVSQELLRRSKEFENFGCGLPKTGGY